MVRTLGLPYGISESRNLFSEDDLCFLSSGDY